MSFVCLSDKLHRGGEVGSQTYRPWLGHGLAAPRHRRGDRRAAAGCRRDGIRSRIRTASWCSPRTRPSGRPRASPPCRRQRPPVPRSTCPPTPSKFTDAGLAPYKAVVFLNTTGDVLDTAQQTAFEKYFSAGGGFLGIGSAIETEPDWQFFTDILGTRSTGATEAVQATIKVADRGHAAGGKVLPEYWTRTDRWYNFAANVRGVSHVIATVDEKTLRGRQHAEPADAADQRSPDRLVQGLPGRPLLLHRGRQHRRGVRRGAVPRAPRRCGPVGRRQGRPGLQRLRRDRARQLSQTKISAPPNLNEPIGFDQLPDGRVIQTARAGQVRLHNPATGSSQVIAEHPGLHQLRGRPLRARGRQQLRRPTSGSTSTTRRRPSDPKCDGTMADVDDPDGLGPDRRR